LEAIVRKRIRASQAFIEQNWQIVAIGQLYSVCQRVVGVHAAVHLGPIQHVFRVSAKRLLVEIPDSIVQFRVMPAKA
jgi:hypothetical protein